MPQEAQKRSHNQPLNIPQRPRTKKEIGRVEDSKGGWVVVLEPSFISDASHAKILA